MKHQFESITCVQNCPYIKNCEQEWFFEQYVEILGKEVIDITIQYRDTEIFEKYRY